MGSIDLKSKLPKSTVVSASSGPFGSLSSSPVAVTNLSVSFTVRDMGISGNRPVLVKLQGDGSAGSRLQSSGTFPSGIFRLIRDSTVLTDAVVKGAHDSTTIVFAVPPGCLSHIDFVPPGTYTYYVDAAVDTGGAGVNVTNCVLVVMEL